MEKNKIISALIGLIGACNNNPKTENTDRIIIKALAFSLVYSETDNETLHALIEEIHTEKYIVAPGCAACQTPCGNTSDYDMNRIYEAETEIRDLKLKILSAVEQLAADIYSRKKVDSLSSESMDFFCKALLYISLDMEKNGLLAFWYEVQDTIKEITRQAQVREEFLMLTAEAASQGAKAPGNTISHTEEFSRGCLHTGMCAKVHRR